MEGSESSNVLISILYLEKQVASMKKWVSALFIIVCVFLFASSAYCKPATPEQLVKDFYVAYLGGEALLSVYDTKEMEKYIDPCTLRTLHIQYLRSYFSRCYFVKSQDGYKGMLDIFTVHKALKVNKTTSVVPITFAFSKDIHQNLLVFVENKNNTYRITKIDTAYLPAE